MPTKAGCQAGNRWDDDEGSVFLIRDQEIIARVACITPRMRRLISILYIIPTLS